MRMGTKNILCWYLWQHRTRHFLPHAYAAVSKHCSWRYSEIILQDVHTRMGTVCDIMEGAWAKLGILVSAITVT